MLGGLDKLIKKVDLVNLKAVSRHDYILKEVRDTQKYGEQDTKEIIKVVQSLATSAAAGFAALDKRVWEIISRPPGPPPPNALE